MKQALFVVSGVAIGLLMALVAVASSGRTYLPHAEAQAGPAGGNGAGAPPTILGTGGSTQNQNDLCWILTTVKPVRGPQRTVLCLYKAEEQGKHFNLKDVRMIDADIRLIELESKKHDLTVPAVVKFLPQEEQDALKPPR